MMLIFIKDNNMQEATRVGMELSLLKRTALCIQGNLLKHLHGFVIVITIPSERCKYLRPFPIEFDILSKLFAMSTKAITGTRAISATIYFNAKTWTISKLSSKQKLFSPYIKSSFQNAFTV